jgi:DnaK suppressor protein
MPVSNDQLRERLSEERARLLEHVNRLGENEYRGSGYGNHMADDGTETFEQAKGISLKRNEASLLWQVERALDKFELGTYGICEGCGAPVDRARLKALPYAQHCLECKNRMENGG